jgi:two-component system phosphate regulon sensor histidine kinase PhoR
MILVTAISFGFMLHAWQGILRAEIERSLTEKARMFADQVNSKASRNIAALTSEEGQRAGARATVIDMNGKVMADSEVRIPQLENEARQPEFVAALHGDTGIEMRSQSLFGIPVLYVAVPVSGGAVRLAYPMSDIGIIRTQVERMLSLISVCALAAALAISATTAGMISRRLALYTP